MERLERIRTDVSDLLASLEVGALPHAEAKSLLDGFVALGKLADAGAVLVTHAVVSADRRGVGAATGDLARSAGVSKAEAERMVATSKALPALAKTRSAMRFGWLSRTQAALVAEAAAVSPESETGLLATATTNDLVGLRRQVERVKAAAGNEETRRRKAHAERSWKTWTRDGTWHCHANGPIVEGAEIEFTHRMFLDAELANARKNGSKEPFGAIAFDAFATMARTLANAKQTGEHGHAGRNGNTDIESEAGTSTADSGTTADSTETTPQPGTPTAAPTGSTIVNASAPLPLKQRRWQAVIRVDATAIRRGHTVPGEICEIPGVGPIDVAAAFDLLGDATVRVLIKDGIDVLSVARVDRYVSPNMQAVLLEKANFECANINCSNTGWLEREHEHDYARSHNTSYINLNCLCSRCHDLKTYFGWTIKHHPDGTIELVPPDDPDPP